MDRALRGRPTRAPAESGDRYTAPIALRPSWCRYRALQRLGPVGSAGPARVERPALLPRRRGPAVAHRNQGSRRAPTRATRLGTTADLGMGIASQDITGDRYPEIYLTSQGTTSSSHSWMDRTRHSTRTSRCPGRDRARPVRGWGEIGLPGMASGLRDVNNDGLTDLFVSKGNVEHQLDYAMKDPSNSSSVSPTAPSGGRHDGGHRVLREARGRPWWTSIGWAAGSRPGHPPGERPPLAHVGAATRPHRRPMGHWLRWTSTRLRQPCGDRRVDRSPSRW